VDRRGRRVGGGGAAGCDGVLARPREDGAGQGRRNGSSCGGDIGESLGANRGADGPGYWLMTRWGSSDAFDVAYLGSPASHGSDICVNQGGPAARRLLPRGPAAAASRHRTVPHVASAGPTGARLAGAEGGVRTLRCAILRLDRQEGARRSAGGMAAEIDGTG